jgi:membrane-bound lytic murein transglycosylase D
MRQSLFRTAIRQCHRLGARHAASALTVGMLLCVTLTPALAERLDPGVLPFQAILFDEQVLDQADTEPDELEPSDGARSDADPADPERMSAEPDAEVAADQADGGAADGADLGMAAQADAQDGAPAAEADAPEPDAPEALTVAEADDQDADDQDADTPAAGEIPEAQPPQLLWRFKTLFAARDAAPDDESDAVEELEEHLSHIPLIVTPRVERHIQYFQTSKRDHFDQWLTRLHHYKPLVEQIFAQFQLPGDLVFLSLVESGFNPKAYSRARAAGPWQFMKATGRVYGLRVDQYVDERRDPIKSTVAAARYLRDLYDLFGTWPLAMAAYNAGERKIQRALRKARAESFWEIAQTRFIRRETREYVPRFVAAAIIAKNPEQYGFAQPSPDVHQFEEIVVSRPLPLRAIAAAAGIPYAELHRLNPELRRDVTPPDDPAYHLKVPVGTRGTVEPVLATLKTWTPPVVTVRYMKASARRPGLYRVRMGDSLSAIAKRFRVPIETLKERNKLAGRSIKVGDLLVVGR